MKTPQAEVNPTLDQVDLALEGAIPRRTGTPEGFALEMGEGIDIRSLESGTTLLVQTRNTHYRMVVVNPDRLMVLATGGELFPQEAEARLNGATSGGSTLMEGWIGLHFRMNLWANGRRIITTPVRSITLESVQ
jgi:hypothetical protein